MNDIDTTGLFTSSGKDTKQSSMAKFKDAIYSAVSNIEEKLNNSTSSLESQFVSRNNIIDSKIFNMEAQLNQLNRQLQDISIKSEKANELILIEKRNNELIVTSEIRISNLAKDLSSACYKYDKVFLDNLLLPGQIGDFCRFKNVKECLDFLITQLGQFTSFKDRALSEIKAIKDKSDNSVRTLNHQFEQMKKNFINTVSLESFEEKMDQRFKNVEDSVFQVHIENNKYAISLKDSCNLLQMDLKELKETKDLMENNNMIHMKEFNEKIAHNNEHYTLIKAQFAKLNRQFNDLAEFIKDVRFKKNINSEVTKNDIKKLTNALYSDDNNATSNNNNNQPETSFRIKSIDRDSDIMPVIHTVHTNTITITTNPKTSIDKLTPHTNIINSTSNSCTNIHNNTRNNITYDTETNNNNELIISKEMNDSKKTKFLSVVNTSPSMSLGHTTIHGSVPFKKNGIGKKNKKKKYTVYSKPNTSVSMSKVEKKAKSQEKDKLLNSSTIIAKQPNIQRYALNEMTLNDQFITKINQAKLAKLPTTNKRFMPPSDFMIDSFI